MLASGSAHHFSKTFGIKDFFRDSPIIKSRWLQKVVVSAPNAYWPNATRETEIRNQLCMDDRLKVAMSAVLIAAMFVTAAGGNWLTFLFFAAMAVIVTWETS